MDRQTEQICINVIDYCAIQESGSISKEELEEETGKDEMLQRIMKCVTTQNWNDLDYGLHSEYESFRRIRDKLCISDGLLLRGERLILPEAL